MVHKQLFVWLEGKTMRKPPFLGPDLDNCATGEKLLRLQYKFRYTNNMLYGQFEQFAEA